MDIVIHGGIIVDRTGSKPRFRADIAIDQGSITKVGRQPYRVEMFRGRYCRIMDSGQRSDSAFDETYVLRDT